LTPIAERGRAGIEDLVRPGHPHQPVAEVAAAVADAHQLGAFAERVRGFSVELPDLHLNLLLVQQLLTGEAVHTGHQFAKIAGDHEIGTRSMNALTGGAVPCRAGSSAAAL
jgi:hypothetical protein